MFYSNATMGGASMLKVEGNRLDFKWIAADGNVFLGGSILITWFSGTIKLTVIYSAWIGYIMITASGSRL
jgi:hypothetical protein